MHGASGEHATAGHARGSVPAVQESAVAECQAIAGRGPAEHHQLQLVAWSGGPPWTQESVHWKVGWLSCLQEPWGVPCMQCSAVRPCHGTALPASRQPRPHCELVFCDHILSLQDCQHRAGLDRIDLGLGQHGCRRRGLVWGATESWLWRGSKPLVGGTRPQLSSSRDVLPGLHCQL